MFPNNRTLEQITTQLSDKVTSKHRSGLVGERLVWTQAFRHII